MSLSLLGGAVRGFGSARQAGSSSRARAPGRSDGDRRQRERSGSAPAGFMGSQPESSGPSARRLAPAEEGGVTLTGTPLAGGPRGWLEELGWMSAEAQGGGTELAVDQEQGAREADDSSKHSPDGGTHGPVGRHNLIFAGPGTVGLSPKTGSFVTKKI